MPEPARIDPEGLVGPDHSSVHLPRLAALRLRAGIKQAELARRLGIDPSLPCLWEAGKRDVPLARLRSLASVLETDVPTMLAFNGVRVPGWLEADLGLAPVPPVPPVPPPNKEAGDGPAAPAVRPRGWSSLGVDGTPMGPWDTRGTCRCSCGQVVR